MEYGEVFYDRQIEMKKMNEDHPMNEEIPTELIIIFLCDSTEILK